MSGDGDYADPGDVSYHQLTDASFSVIAHVDHGTGLVRQWMSYDAFGVMRVLRGGDFNGDGAVNVGDWTEFNAAFNDLAGPVCCHMDFRSGRFLRASRSAGGPVRFEPAHIRVPGKGGHRRSCESSSVCVEPVEVERKGLEPSTPSLQS